MSSASMFQRRRESRRIRILAAEDAILRNHQVSVSNGEEEKHTLPNGKQSYIASFSKGLYHRKEDGLLANPDIYSKFVDAINSGVPSDLAAIRIGIPDGQNWESVVARCGFNGKPTGVRGWESASAGLAYDLQGPDAQSVAMPPAPTLGSDELRHEMAELYLMALARDTPFINWRNNRSNFRIQTAVQVLSKTDWTTERSGATYTEAESLRRILRYDNSPNVGNIFRGIGRGTNDGPYISQFLLQGSKTLGGGAEDGIIMYGAQEMSLKVRRTTAGKDWMTTYNAWLDVQNGANVGAAQHPDYVSDSEGRRTKFISTPRDLATYVHHDALYQAYLNACLILLAEGAKFDEGIPFGASDEEDSQQGFALFGGPHVLTLVTEVATRALKAVRYQKFNIHRRIRPEGVGGLVHLQEVAKGDSNGSGVPGRDFGPEVEGIRNALRVILPQVKDFNKEQNNKFDDRKGDGDSQGTFLLPMAFPEGSPMHPTYGAGHAAVAGACVTIIKAFFDVKQPYPSDSIVEANEEGNSLIEVLPKPELTIEGELNKVASNIAFGRSIAGVHYASDNIESLLLGERIAIGILKEQALTYGEKFSMTIPLFYGGEETITSE